jgi:hypothetical protein
LRHAANPFVTKSARVCILTADEPTDATGCWTSLPYLDETLFTMLMGLVCSS